jgi:hypothetical protein
MPKNTWIGDTSGIHAWDDAANWSRGIVPDSSSLVTIGEAGNYSVVIAASDQPYVIGSLTLSGTGNHTLLDRGSLSVIGNTRIAGNTIQIAANGSASFANVNLDSSATLVEQGSFRATGTLNGTGGTVDVVGGNLLAGAINGSNTYSISLGGTLEVDGRTSGNSTLSFVDGNTNALVFDNPGTKLAAHITGLSGSDTIDISSLAFSSAYTTNYDGKTLKIEHGTIPVFTFSNISNAGSVSLAAAPGGGTMIAACYLKGTLILTDAGERPVEELAIGDRLVTLSGDTKRIKWIGRRSYQGRFIAGNRDVLPIRFTANSLADGVPSCNLEVSPNHAIYIDGALVPAKRLVNGATIYQLNVADSVEYFHIELPTHNVIFAGGTPAESFVDCDSRGIFHNASEFSRLYPDDASSKWAFCAPLIEGGDVLQAIRRRLDARTESFGYTTTFDPGISLLVDGRAITATVVNGYVYQFELTKPPTDVRIMSRSGVPAEVDCASVESRRLGVNLRRLVLKNSNITVTVEHPHPWLIEGFHEAEAAHRWTDGEAHVPAAFFSGFTDSLTIDVEVLDHTIPYRTSPRSSLELETNCHPQPTRDPSRHFDRSLTAS